MFKNCTQLLHSKQTLTLQNINEKVITSRFSYETWKFISQFRTTHYHTFNYETSHQQHQQPLSKETLAGMNKNLHWSGALYYDSKAVKPADCKLK